MVKKPHQKKNQNLNQNTNTDNKDTELGVKTLSNITSKKIEESLKEFGKRSEKERSIFEGTEFMEQFWGFFKEKHPSLLDEIDTQEKLNIYAKHLEKMGFSFENIINSKELNKEFNETNNEKETIKDSLKQLQEYCNSSENKMPQNIFEDFAKYVNLETRPRIEISKQTKISKIGNLFSARINYLEKNNITLKDNQKSEIEKKLCPKHVPTKRLLISAAIKKIKKDLPDGVIADFELDFPLPIDIHSSFENLKDLKNKRIIFLDSHKNQIDENLAKKLDKIIVNNGDIYKELQYEGENIEWTKGFSEQTKNFRIMFNQLATRQLFEETKNNEVYLEDQITRIGESFKKFPPYLNELFNIYQYKDKDVLNDQNIYKAEFDKQEVAIKNQEKELEKTDITDEQRKPIVKKIKEIKKEQNITKRKAYAEYIKKQDEKLGTITSNIVDKNFDISKLGEDEKQYLINKLVSSKLGDITNNQIPNILGIEKTEYQKFITDLFDLKNKEIIIPTQYGNIPIQFLEKNILGGPAKDSMEINSSGNVIAEQETLPLNLKIKVTEQNRDFFEENIIFEDIFDTFTSQKGPVKLNDSYKVKIKNKDGIEKTGYFSKEAPNEEIKQELENGTGKDGRFLYSHPITRPEDARTIMTRDDEPNGNPIFITKEEESEYDINIESKEINLNGEGISALLFSHTLGQYTNINNDISAKQEKKLFETFGKLKKDNLYKDTIDKHDKKEETEQTEQTEDIQNEKEIQKKNDKKDFLAGRNNLEGYKDEAGEKGEYGFKKGAKLLIRGPESEIPPSGTYMYMTAEIDEIDEENGIFKLKFKGNECSLGKHEGAEISYPLNKEGLLKLKESSENKIYKIPPKDISSDLNKSIGALVTSKIDGIDINDSFQRTARKGDKFIIDIGKEQGKEVTHFGLIESIPGENPSVESTSGYMYKIEHDSDKKSFKITLNDKSKTTKTLDYTNFLLFIASRKLQPQTEETKKEIDTPESEGAKLNTPKKRNGYSIASVMGMVKNFSKKIGDQLKKYEEEQTEELTESMFYRGKLFYKLAKYMPTAKLKHAFGNAGDEYMLARDDKTYKKIGEYLKFYEGDPDFGGDFIQKENIKPFLDGDKPFEDHYQPAAMLLAIIKKGKGPYSRNTDRAGKGKRVKILLGQEHQKRYLMMKEKLQKELEQGYNLYGQVWADDLQNEILKLEMKYISHCIDGKQLKLDSDDSSELEAMYSKKFAGELETESSKFFTEAVNGNGKEKGYNFDLARFEYYRQIGDRPQQAIPCLKQMACKAVSPSQWKTFESAVITGMLSGVFYNITQEDKGLIQKICRTIGFLPGMWIKDPNHHKKIEKLIKIATNKTPQYKKGEENKDYKNENHTFGKAKNIDFFKDTTSFDSGINKRLIEDGNLGQITNFANMTGKNYEGKTIIELINDPKTSNEIKVILKEIESKSLETGETVDSEVKANGYSLEQNILAKSESLIDEITTFQGGKFKGKDKDEIQGIQTARKQIAKEIPQKELEDKNQVIYIIKKFMNRFESRGFNTEEKRFLIRALLTVKKEIDAGNEKSADDILWYVIVGNIINRSGSEQPPEELVSGLEAFKKFFKTNISTILENDVIEKSMHKMFIEEKEKGPYQIADWEEFSDLQETKFFIGKTKDETRIRSEKKKKYSNTKLYINDIIYKKANDVERKNHMENKFKNYIKKSRTKTITQEIKETLDPKGINIKNGSVLEKIKRKASGKSNLELTEEEILLAQQEEEENNYW